MINYSSETKFVEGQDENRIHSSEYGRTKHEGIEIAKQKGKYIGRKRIKSPAFDQVVAKWKASEITAVKAMDLLKMSRNTFYRRNKWA